MELRGVVEVEHKVDIVVELVQEVEHLVDHNIAAEQEHFVDKLDEEDPAVVHMLAGNMPVDGEDILKLIINKLIIIQKNTNLEKAEHKVHNLVDVVEDIAKNC